jgi:mono/diheme cytochrome c family protein
MMPNPTISPNSDERTPTIEWSMGYQKSRHIRRSEVLLLGMLLLCGGIGLGLAQTEEVPDRGQSIYRQYCLECHGASGRGDGAKAPFLSPRPGNLVSAATSAKTNKELLRIITRGKSHTVIAARQEGLSAEDQQAVLQYVRSLVKFSRPSAPTLVTP